MSSSKNISKRVGKELSKSGSESRIALKQILKAVGKGQPTTVKIGNKVYVATQV